MEAKDTVMKLEDIERIVNKVLKEHILPLPYDYVQAGYDEAIKIRSIKEISEACGKDVGNTIKTITDYQAGIKEVVDWIKKREIPKDVYPWVEGLIMFRYSDIQAFLKEKGIDR